MSARLDVVTVSLHCLYTRVLVRRASCVAPPRPTRLRRRASPRGTDRPRRIVHHARETSRARRVLDDLDDFDALDALG